MTHCISAAECSAPTPVCNALGCEQCFESNDCPATEACYGGACHPAPPGETCNTAIALPFTSGSVLVQGSFLPYDFEDSRNSSLESDVFFRIEVTQESALNLDLTLGGLIPRGSASIHASCGGEAISAGLSQRDVFVVPGPYWIRVSKDFSSADFTLRVWTTPASRAVGNHCLKPIVLTLDGQGHAAATGDTRGLASVGASTCNGADARLIYDVEVPVLSYLGARLHPLDTTFDSSLDLKLTCLGSLRQCIAGPPGGDRFAQLERLEPGHVTVQVSNRNGTAGPFELEVDVSPWALNDSCTTAAPLVFDGGFASGKGLEHANSGECTCFALLCNTGRQLWRLSTLGQGTRSLQLRLVPSGARPPAGLSLITQCDPFGSPSSVLGCDAQPRSGPRIVDVPALPEGDYFVEVGSSQSPFTLEAQLGPSFPPPANDTCAGAQVVDLSSGAVTASGDTRGADFDTPPYCSGNDPGEGRDVVYRLQATQRGRATVTVTPDAPAFDPVLHALGTCTNGFSSDPCANDGGTGGAETLSIDLVGAPKYLWVKGAGGTSGTFQLQGSFTPGPANDTCASATVLTVPQTVSGTTSGAFHDYNQCDSLPSGPDVFYRFTYVASNNGMVNVTLTPSGFDARLFVLTTTCTATSCTRMVNGAGTGLAETLALPVSRNVTYYLGVDGDDGGTFTLSVQ